MAVEPTELFNGTGYRTTQSKNIFLLRKTTSYFFFFLLAFLTCFILILAININSEMLIFLIPILALPFINDGWKFPSKMVFDSNNDLLALYRPFFIKRLINYDQINDISVSHTVKSASTSPFEEGNKDITYRIYLELGNDKIFRLLKIKSRKEISKEIKKLTDFIQHRIKLSHAIPTDS